MNTQNGIPVNGGPKLINYSLPSSPASYAYAFKRSRPSVPHGTNFLILWWWSWWWWMDGQTDKRTQSPGPCQWCSCPCPYASSCSWQHCSTTTSAALMCRWTTCCRRRRLSITCHRRYCATRCWGFVRSLIHCWMLDSDSWMQTNLQLARFIYYYFFTRLWFSCDNE